MSKVFSIMLICLLMVAGSAAAGERNNTASYNRLADKFNHAQPAYEQEEENNQTSVLMITGADFDELEEKYEKSQEKYLDMGHLQVLILSDRLLENERWQVLLDYLKEEPFVGENVYVFRAEDPREILEWEGGSGTSVGEYLVGILENRVSGQEKKGVTLREVYQQRYLTGGMRILPKVRLSGTELEVWM